MSDVASTQDAAASALLDYIRRECERECAAITQQADDGVRGILRDARHAGRLHVRRALAGQRADIEAQCLAAHVASDARLRHQRQRLARGALDQGWLLLQDELTARWADPRARMQWILGTLVAASQRLACRAWVVHCPSAWSTPERDAALATLAQKDAGISVQWQADTSLRAGLRVEADGAFVDGSPQGILAQREWVEGQLLARIEHVAAVSPV